MANLNLPQVASNQNQKEVTINDQAEALDDALTEHLSVDLSAAGVTLTAAQWTRSWFFELTGHSVARTVIIPATKRPAVVKNAGTAAVTLQVQSGGSAVVDSGQAVMVYNDGVNLTVTGGGGGAEYPDMAGNAGKVLAVNSTEDDVEWVRSRGGQAFAPHTGNVSASSSVYAAKGGLMSPLIDMQIYGLSMYAAVAVGATYSLQLWSLSPTNVLVAKLGEAAGLTFTAAENRFVLGSLPAPASVSAGTTYAVLLVRTDATDSTSSGAMVASSVAGAAPVNANTNYARLAKKSPAPGDVLETGASPFAAGIFWSL